MRTAMTEEYQEVVCMVLFERGYRLLLGWPRHKRFLDPPLARSGGERRVDQARALILRA